MIYYSYCGGTRPPIPKSVILNPHLSGSTKLPPINSSHPEDSGDFKMNSPIGKNPSETSSKPGTPSIKIDGEDPSSYSGIMTSPIKSSTKRSQTAGTSTRRLPLSVVKPLKKERPVTPDLHPVDVSYTKYTVLRENDWKARHPKNMDDEYYEHHKIMDAWRDNITSLFNGNQGYVATSTYSKHYTDPWVLKKKFAVSRFD